MTETEGRGLDRCPQEPRLHRLRPRTRNAGSVPSSGSRLQLSAHADLGKQQVMASVMGFLVSSFGCCRHLKNEPVDRISFSLCLLVSQKQTNNKNKQKTTKAPQNENRNKKPLGKIRHSTAVELLRFSSEAWLGCIHFKAHTTACSSCWGNYKYHRSAD